LQKDTQFHRCLATLELHIPGQGLLGQELLLSRTLEVEHHPHNRATLEPHLRAIQEPHAPGTQEPLQVKDMGELHHLSNRAILGVVPTPVMEEPHPHSNSLDMEEPHPHRLDMAHNLNTISKAILELHPPNTRVTVLPLSSSRWTLKLHSGSELLTKTGVDRLMPRSCRGLSSMATGATSMRRHAG